MILHMIRADERASWERASAHASYGVGGYGQ